MECGLTLKSGRDMTRTYSFQLLFDLSMANLEPSSRRQSHVPDVTRRVFWEPHNKVESLSPLERLVGFELGTSVMGCF